MKKLSYVGIALVIFMAGMESVATGPVWQLHNVAGVIYILGSAYVALLAVGFMFREITKD